MSNWTPEAREYLDGYLAQVRALVRQSGEDAEETAAERHLRGWVRNRRDGTVEAVFIGPEAGVAAMIAACRQGPRSALVTGVAVRDATVAELAVCGSGGFAQLPTC